VLTAWLFAGGSLGAAQFVPLLAVGEGDPRGLAESALQAIGTGAQCHRADSDARATELRPAKTASHLGRFLHAVMGAPLGQKAEQPDLSLPGWLETVGASTQLRWARTYVTVRGTAADPAHGYDCHLREARPESYLAGLGRLFQSLAPPETVTTGSQTVRLRPAVTRELKTVPMLPPPSQATASGVQLQRGVVFQLAALCARLPPDLPVGGDNRIGTVSPLEML
jgi:hypothetical protein